MKHSVMMMKLVKGDNNNKRNEKFNLPSDVASGGTAVEAHH